MSAVRGRPPRLAGGTNGAVSAHSASVISDGYRSPSRLCSRRAIPVHVTIHSISSQRGVNHNMLVLLNNFRFGHLDKAVGSTLGAERPLPAKAAVYDLGRATAFNVQLVHWLCPRRAIPVRVMSHPVSLHSRMDTPDRYPFGVRHRSALPLHRPVRSKALVERSPLQRPKQPACRSLHGATMVPYHSWWMDRDC